MSETTSTATASAVRVSRSGDDAQAIEYVAGETVAYYLGVAEVSVGEGQSISLNGCRADLSTVVEPGSVIVVTTSISNG